VKLAYPVRLERSAQKSMQGSFRNLSVVSANNALSMASKRGCWIHELMRRRKCCAPHWASMTRSARFAGHSDGPPRPAMTVRICCGSFCSQISFRVRRRRCRREARFVHRGASVRWPAIPPCLRVGQSYGNGWLAGSNTH